MTATHESCCVCGGWGGGGGREATYTSLAVLAMRIIEDMEGELDPSPDPWAEADDLFLDRRVGGEYITANKDEV